MATKTSNVSVRVEPVIKEQAEAILDKLGISVSSFINMTYRQLILQNGIPYDVKLPSTIKTLDSVSNEEFAGMVAEAESEYAADEVLTSDEAFSKLLKR